MALVPRIRTFPPLPGVLFLRLMLILRLFYLTFKKEDQPLGLSLSQNPRVLPQGSAVHIMQAQPHGPPLTFEVIVLDA